MKKLLLHFQEACQAASGLRTKGEFFAQLFKQKLPVAGDDLLDALGKVAPQIRLCLV